MSPLKTFRMIIHTLLRVGVFHCYFKPELIYSYASHHGTNSVIVTVFDSPDDLL